MTKSLKAHLELVSESDILNKVMERDVPKLLDTSSPAYPEQKRKFKEENLLAFYVLINTWLILIQQWSQYFWSHVRAHILDDGVVSVIKRFSSAADQLVRGEYVEDSLARNLIHEVTNQCVVRAVPTDPAFTIHTHANTACLMLLRYGKRFSPLNALKLHQASIDSFKSTQDRLAVLQRSPAPEYIIRWVREEVSNFLDWDSLLSELEKYHVSDGLLTPGVSRETNAVIMSKLKMMMELDAEFFPRPFNAPVVATGFPPEEETWGRTSSDGAPAAYSVHPVKVMPVPKNYKTSRLIAPESLLRQARARRYFQIADRYLPGSVSIHDQTQNQELARQGSIDGSLSTLDLSSASDSITRTLLCSIFPARFVALLDEILPTHWEETVLTYSVKPVKAKEAKVDTKTSEKKPKTQVSAEKGISQPVQKPASKTESNPSKKPQTPPTKGTQAGKQPGGSKVVASQAAKLKSEKSDKAKQSPSSKEKAKTKVMAAGISTKEKPVSIKVETKVMVNRAIKRRLLQSAATMGNSMTFWLESVIFACIAQAAVRWFNLLTGSDYRVISVYGDDIIVPTPCAPVVIEWLEALGFVVNHDKSFFDPDHHYRESCGEEYWDGVRVSTVYFPRFPLEGKLGSFSSKARWDEYRGTYISTMTAMIDLQHKLYNVSMPAAMFLSDLIMAAEPRMTTSTPDEGKDDLWLYESRAKIFSEPYGEWREEPVPPIWIGREKCATFPRVRPKELKRINVPGRTKETHLTPIVKSTMTKADVEAYAKKHPMEVRLLTLYNYSKLLRNGPEYDTPLDRILGVSSKPMDLATAIGELEVVWIYI